jgi:SAM-dependent methyltransferase
MGVKLPRKKPRNLVIAVVYRMRNLIPLGKKGKFRLFMNLEWIFNRLSHEMSFHFYSPMEHPLRVLSRPFILDHLNNQNVVLDLGCNLGEITYVVAEKAKEAVGIDYNGGAIKKAKQQFQRPNLTFLHREAYEYLLENSKQFDTLILSHVLEHLDDPRDFLMKFKGFFKQIYIEVPDFDRYFLNIYRKDIGGCYIHTDDDHISEFDRDELKALFKECNLEIVKEEYKYSVQKFWLNVK